MGGWVFVDTPEWVLDQIGASTAAALCGPAGLGLDRGRADVAASGAAQDFLDDALG